MHCRSCILDCNTKRLESHIFSLETSTFKVLNFNTAVWTCSMLAFNEKDGSYFILPTNMNFTGILEFN